MHITTFSHLGTLENIGMVTMFKWGHFKHQNHQEKAQNAVSIAPNNK